MKIAVINSGNHGSIGNIIWGIAEKAKERNHQTFVFCPSGKMQIPDLDNEYIGTIIERRLSDLVNTYTGYQGKFNYWGTNSLIKKLKEISPDIVHLHNLHNNYVNIKMLFDYLVASNIEVVWTLHDCWAFTGNCPHFTVMQCEKWKSHCTKCEYRGYPKGKIDRGYNLFEKKKQLFTSINNMTIVTPSKWLAELVQESFLGKYSIKIINNGIDLRLFRPVENDFRQRYQLENKFIILTVAFSWGYRKGLDRIQRLSKVLDDKFQLVIVGTKQETHGINNAICIQRTYNQEELIRIYSAADVFLNPTREDTFPTVNMEALACGLPVLSYGACGSAEAFDDTCGCIVNDDDIVRQLNIIRINNFEKNNCILRASDFDKNKKFMEYIELYEQIGRLRGLAFNAD